MNTPSKEDTLKKWGTIIESMGITGSKADWMSGYLESHQKNEINTSNSTTEDFPTLLPMSMKIAAKTIGTDIVSVSPIGGGNTPDELKKIREDIKIENRDRKIDSIVENKEFEEVKVEDHPDYIKTKGPSPQLFYMDFVYGGTESNYTM